MAGDWMKVQLDLPDKPEVHVIAWALKIDPDAVVGKLLRIWAWFDKHTEDGNAKSVTPELLDRITSVAGFAAAMESAGWMVTKNGGLTVPKFDRHNGKTAKNRALTGERVKRLRNDSTVTKALPEKRREEKSIKDQEPPADADPWKIGKEFLIAHGVSKSSVGSFIGKLVKDHGKENVVEALQAAIVNEPADVKSYIVGALRGKTAKFDPVAANLAFMRSQS